MDFEAIKAVTETVPTKRLWAIDSGFIELMVNAYQIARANYRAQQRMNPGISVDMPRIEHEGLEILTYLDLGLAEAALFQTSFMDDEDGGVLYAMAYRYDISPYRLADYSLILNDGGHQDYDSLYLYAYQALLAPHVRLGQS